MKKISIYTVNLRPILLVAVFATICSSFSISQANTPSNNEIEKDLKTVRELEIKSDTDTEVSKVDINLGRECYKKAAEAYTLKKEIESKCWNYASFSLYEAANQIDKACDSKKNENKELFKNSKAAADQYQQSSEYFIQAATAYSTKNMSKAKTCYDAGLSSVQEAEQLSKN
jgi:hypothetical protein